MVAMNLRRLGVCNKFIQQILRHANVTTTMDIDVKTHSEWHEEPGNDVCNYCANPRGSAAHESCRSFSGK